MSLAISNNPYWWDSAPLDRHDALPIVPRVDVAIIGAGYAGMTAALFLARAGRSVQVFDRERPGEGASSRNGGITSGNIRASASTLARRFGADKAADIAKEGALARQWLADFINEEAIDADLQRVGRFSGALSVADYELQARGADALARDLGVEAFAVTKAEVGKYLSTDFYSGGVVRMDIGGLHPAKFHAGLVALATKAGAVVQGCCRVERVKQSGDGYLISSSRGECVARNVIIATNGYTDHFDRWLRQRLVPVRSRIIATVPLGKETVRRLVPQLMMLTDSRELSYYYRPSPDGTRILFGGRDGTVMGESQAPTDHLRRELGRVFPELSSVEISHSWYGYVGMNRDMVPRVFTRDGKRYGTGFCGSGVVWAPWVGKKLADQLVGKPHSGTAFDFRPPGLVPTIAGKSWFMPLVFMIKEWQDRKKQ